MKKFYFSLLIVIMAITGGCNYNNKASNEVGDNQNGSDLLKVGYHKQGNRHIGINKDEITDQNPNFLNLSNDNETHVNNIGIDVKKAKDVIGANTQFKAGPVWTNGNNMSVTVYTDRHMTKKQENQARAQLEKEITAALPRYDINVKIGNR